MTRRLIMNVADNGIHPGAVAAAVEAIADGVAAPGSVMAVAAGTAPALELLADRPDLPVGVHLTLTADCSAVPWRALTGGPTISDEGRLLGLAHRERLLARAEADEVRAEFRAQIETVLGAGVRPTHLDWHCLADGGREDGLSEWAMHPAMPRPEDEGAQVRLSDHEFLLVPSTRQVLDQEHIIVTGYGDGSHGRVAVGLISVGGLSSRSGVHS